jgi:F-type H+-transporting ATPase subunit delta
MIRTTAQSKRKARQLFRFCVVHGRLDRGRVLNVVSTVRQIRHRGYFRLLKEFQRLVRLEVQAHTAKIESAAALSHLLESKVRESVESAYGAQTTTLFECNPGLIGGMRIRIGSDVYDGTVQGKLSALKRSLGILENGERV